MARIYTVGHSTRSRAQLVALLQSYGVATLVDVRHYPRSRRNPQFNQEALAAELPGSLSYVWLGEELGGLRPGGFRAYMKERAFADGMARLEALAATSVAAVMCAEDLWSRCHRRFIARALYVRGHQVWHIRTQARADPEGGLSRRLPDLVSGRLGPPPAR